ncbi:MAG: hypothetical protein Q4B60_03550 [Erysipelotrichaceae bacterium]|nr:hypothetical protein [Erysipelotrichaceae bacterium]
MKEFLKKYNLKYLKTSVNKYGFNFSYKSFFLSTILLMTFIFLISYISYLKIEYMLLLIMLSLIVLPMIILSFCKQAYSIQKFNMLTDYLGNIIPIFTQKTKIRYTLGELFDIASSNMKESIKKAIHYLDNTTSDPDLSKNALRIIEEDFPNSRVRSVHKLLLSIESQNSVVYEDVCQNMYEDIECWIKRIYKFQKDLKNRRTKLIVLCLVTLMMNSLFAYLYVSNEFFIGFTKTNLYQIITLLFIASVMITITILSIKLHGEWLINDLSSSDDEYLKKYYEIYRGGLKKPKIADYIMTVLSIAGAVYLFIQKEYLYMLICLVLGLMILFNYKRRYKRAYRIVNKALIVEFPIWLREISLSLNNLTVINAIELSQNMASYPLRKEIRKFLNEVKKDPTSIKPYNEFLSDFDLEDARSSMKVLYAIQNIGKEDVGDRISNLIIRNQEMLDKAESIRNNDSIGGIEALGYVPTVLFCFQMIISMFGMFGYMMSNINGAINL